MSLSHNIFTLYALNYRCTAIRKVLQHQKARKEWTFSTISQPTSWGLIRWLTQGQTKTVFHRINPKSCEWLTRPKIATSEFASTITENLELLAKNKHVAVKKQKFLAMQETLAPFLASLKALNTKTEDQPTSSDVKQVLRTMLSDNEEMDEFFDGLFQTGGTMYVLGIHYGVVKTLLTNPSQYAERVVGMVSDVSTFKSNPTNPGMQRFLTGQCSSQEPRTGHTYVKARRNLGSLLEDHSENEEASTSGSTQELPERIRKRCNPC